LPTKPSTEKKQSSIEPKNLQEILETLDDQEKHLGTNHRIQENRLGTDRLIQREIEIGHRIREEKEQIHSPLAGHHILKKMVTDYHMQEKRSFEVKKLTVTRPRMWVKKNSDQKNHSKNNNI